MEYRKGSANLGVWPELWYDLSDTKKRELIAEFKAKKWGDSAPGELHDRPASAKARAAIHVAAVAYSGTKIPRMPVCPRPSLETHSPKIPNVGPVFNPFSDKIFAVESTYADSDASPGGANMLCLAGR